MQNDKPYIEQVANMLGVELLEEFKIRPTELAKAMGYKEDDKTYRFDTELAWKDCDYDTPNWYSFDCSVVLYRLIIGLYEIVKGGVDNAG